MPDHKWQRIQPLTDAERQIDLAAMKPLYDAWATAQEQLRVSSKEGLDLFTQRLIRRLSIETGILERLYDLDRGTTEALVANGFAEELVSHSSTDIEPSRLIDILRDQEAAIQLIMDCVAGNRPLSKAVIHELHSILVHHQDTTTAVDQFGNRFEILLLKGKFKEQSNNPRRLDDSTHEYCPPVHVESEMDQLLTWLEDYRDEDPVLVASWLHHRFTQIHPYQDGNGRVIRAVTTLALLRAGLLPTVIGRDMRVEYLNALEAADFGSLAKLTELIARLERTVILQALSVDADAEIDQERRLTTAVIRTLAAKFNRRRQEKDATLRKVNDVAFDLRARTHTIVEKAFQALAKPITEIVQPQIHMLDGGPDRDNSHWYKFEVVQSGREAGKFVNFEEAHYFIKATMRVERERLVFVTSLHHVGRDLSGIMEATAFARLESYEDSDDRTNVSNEFFLCSLDPFVFAHQTDFDSITGSFDLWLDSAIAVAFKEFGDRL